MQTGTTTPEFYTKTLILLYIGYFVDFYDLTIFSANYNNIIRDLFHIYDPIIIQQLFLKISNFNTLGIICGGILFGVLGDKYGRSFVIKYSIIIYSIAIFLSIFTHSINLFILLRFISGLGLATEFATSSVLISELSNNYKTKNALSFLYASGILGGITATLLGAISWQIMFLAGSSIGFILFFCRKNIFESNSFLNLNKNVSRGNILEIFNNKKMCLKFIQLFCLIIPFYFTISIMFILPNFMHLQENISTLTHTLLIYFFIGNLISIFVYNYYRKKIINPKYALIINSILFLLILSTFSWVTERWFTIYAIAIGFICGGLPTIWIEIVAKSYKIHIRNTGANLLYVAGRGSSIIFNLLISVWLINKNYFLVNVACSVCIITILSLLATISMNGHNQR